jgi:biopolymer transport protein ExbD
MKDHLKMVWIGATLLLATDCAQATRTSVDACPMEVSVSKGGKFYTNRFQGHYKTSVSLLERDLQAGCYNDSNPSKVTSVTVIFAPSAPHQAVERLYQILERNGWPKSRLKVHL